MFMKFLLTRALCVTCLFSLTLIGSGLTSGPVITATKDDAVPAATAKVGGSTVTYTNTVKNTGSVDATGVTFTDPDVAHTALSGAVKVTPVAFDDAYNAVGNTLLTVNAANGLLVNDIDSDHLPHVGTNVKVASVTRTGGAVSGSTLTVAADGSFTYLPGLGGTGTEIFTYLITDSDLLDSVTTGTITFTVTGRVWYLVNGGSGDGRSTTPSGSPSAMSTSANAPTDVIYVYFNASSLNGAFTLANGVSLVGEGVALVVNTTTLRAAGSIPTILNSAGNAVSLGQNNTLSGFNVGSTSGTALVGASVGALGVSTVAINTTGAGLDLTGSASPALNVVLTSLTSSGGTNNVKLTTLGGIVNVGSGALSGSSGSAVVVNGGTGSVSYSGTLTQTTAARVVDIQNKTGGTVAFSGAITSNNGTGQGIFLNANTGATINFTGGLSLSTVANNAFTATGGGTVSATQNNTSIVNTLTTTTGTALNVANTTIGASGLIFRSITAGTAAGSAGFGISLNTTGASGVMTVTGNGTAGSGGTIQHKTGADGSTTSGIGIYLNSTSGVSLSRMLLHDFDNFGIRGTSVTGFSLTNSTINGVNGTTEAGGSEEGAIRFDGLFTSGSFPTAQITGSTIQGGYSVNVRVQNTTGTLNRLLIDNCTLGPVDPSATHGGSSVLYDAASGATFNWTVSNSSFTASRSHMLNATGHGGSHMDAIVSTNNIINGAAAANILSGAAGIVLQGGDLGAADLTFNITGNNISTTSGAKGAGINIFRATNSASGLFDGTIANNNIGVVGQTLSGASNSAPAIWIQDHGAGTFNTLIQNNIIVEYGEEAIDLQGTGAPANLRASTLNASIFGNVVTPNAANGFCGLNIEQGAVTGDAGTMNIVVGNASGTSPQRNNFQNGDPTNTTDIQILRAGSSSTVLNLSRNGSGSATPTLVLQDDNIGGAATSVGDFSPGNRNLVNTLPTLPTHLMFAAGGIERADATVMDLGTNNVNLPVSITSAAQAVTPSVIPTTVTAPLSKAATPPAVLTQAELDSIVSAAIARWDATGLTKEQLARMRSVTFEVTDLPGWYLGEANGTRIRVDNNAGGNGWYVDASPESDELFGTIISPTRRYTDPASAPAGRIDLFSAVLHEFGHALGLCDSYVALDRDSIMFGNLTKGERRFPAKGQAIGAQPNEDGVTHFLGAPISLGTLPAGKSVNIIYTVQVENPISPTTTTSTSSQGTVSGSNFASVLTDDPTVGGAADPTVTLLAPPPTVTLSTTAIGANATTVFINGTNFDPTASNNTVTFSGAITGPGTVTAATTTQLTVTISGQVLGALNAVVGTLAGNSGVAVQVGTVVPAITADTSNLAASATSIVINGFGFSSTPANNTVVFTGGTAGTVTAASSTQLTVNVSNLTSGSLTATVAVGGFTSSSAQIATVFPVITGSTANLGANATSLVINGSGFSTTLASNVVTFSGAITGTPSVTAATATSLTVTLSGQVIGALNAVVVTNGISSGAPVQVATIIPVITPNTANVAANSPGLSINGFGFNANPLNDNVTLSGAGTRSGPPTAASTTGLGVSLPSPVTAGVLNATMTNNGISSGAPVQVATITPVVSSSSASLAATATSVTINGFGFDTTSGNNLVSFNNGALGSVTSATNTALTVTFSAKPTSAGPLTAVVTTNSVSSGTAVQVANVGPVVTANTAQIQSSDSTVTINGFGFASLNANNTVTSHCAK